MAQDKAPEIAAFEEKGFTVIESVYTPDEVAAISACVADAQGSDATFRRSGGLFAIRRFLKEIPQALPLIFNQKLCNILNAYGSANHFVVKSIYFDKPAGSNWFVVYHQDLTISVTEKIDTEGFGPWTVKPDQFSVQAPASLLKEILTVRIHLDDTDAHNGALRILQGTHREGILRHPQVSTEHFTEHTCSVKSGGVMLMRPLLMHASSRSRHGSGRRVIHIELCDREPGGNLQWAEKCRVMP